MSTTNAVIAESPALVTAETFNCGDRCRAIATPIAETETVWAGGMKFCADCSCFPHAQAWRAQAPPILAPLPIAAE